MDHYFTIEGPAHAEFKDRGSKFLAFAFPVRTVAEFKKKLQELKKEHPKAAHHCFAYRIGDESRISDDGEPPGTAGRPILGQIDSDSLLNVAVIVVRYFGGTLLGVPGLINAYKTSASLALEHCSVIQKFFEDEYQIDFDYSAVNTVMTIIKQYHCTVVEQDLQLFCRMRIGIPRKHTAEVLSLLKDARIELKKTG